MTQSAKERARRLCEQIQKKGKDRGLLIAFEGPDGSGKTTQRKLFKDWLVGEGHSVVTTKWNSSKLIKPLIKARKNMRSINQEEFCLLHAADFRHRLENEVIPALLQGKMVVADRFLFTALARDAARGLELDWLLHIYSPLYWPDIVFYFSVSPETSGKRIAATRMPKYYEAGQDVTNIADPLESYRQFIGRVIQEYDALSIIFKFITIDAEQPIYDQHVQIRKLFEESRERPWPEWNEEAITDWAMMMPRGRGVAVGSKTPTSREILPISTSSKADAVPAARNFSDPIRHKAVSRPGMRQHFRNEWSQNRRLRRAPHCAAVRHRPASVSAGIIPAWKEKCVVRDALPETGFAFGALTGLPRNGSPRFRRTETRARSFRVNGSSSAKLAEPAEASWNFVLIRSTRSPPQVWPTSRT
jgi:dTMP kinase